MKKSIFKKLAIIAPFAVAAVAMPIALTSCSETSQTTDDGNNEGSGSNNQDQTINVDLSVVGSSINNTITSKVGALADENNISSTQDSIKSELNAIENMKDSVSSVSISLSSASVSNETNRTATVTVTFNNNVDLSGNIEGYTINEKTISKSGFNTNVKGTLLTPVVEQKSITLTGSENVFTTSEFSDFVNNKINEVNNKKQILKDKLTDKDFTNEQLANIKLSIEPSSFTKSEWGKTPYSEWKNGQPATSGDGAQEPGQSEVVTKAAQSTPVTEIVYNGTTNEKILLGGNGTNQRNLKTYLTDNANLKKIFDAAKGASAKVDPTNTTTIALVEGSNIGYTDNGLLHVNVSETTTTQAPTESPDGAKIRVAAAESAVKYYDLQIPASCLGLQLDNSKLTVSGSSIIGQEVSDFSLRIDIGNANITEGCTIDYTNNNIEVADATDPTIGKVLKALGWGDEKQSSNEGSSQEPGAGANVYTEAEEIPSEPATTLELNSTKIGQDLGIFNTTFTNATLNTISSATEGGTQSKAINPEGYTITLTAKPNDGFCWDDGSKEQRSFTTGKLDLRVKDAKAADATLASYTLNQKFDGSSPLTNEWLTTYFTNTENFNHFKNILTSDNATKDKFANVNFKFVSVEVPAKVNVIEKTGINSEAVKVKVACTPTAGHSFDNSSIEPKEVIITITTLNDWAKDAKYASTATLSDYTLLQTLPKLDNASLTGYFSEKTNFEDFITKVNGITSTEPGVAGLVKNATKQFENVDFTFKSIESPVVSGNPSGKESPENLNNVIVVLDCTPKHGHSFSDGSIDAKQVKITITLLKNKPESPAGPSEDGASGEEGAGTGKPEGSSPSTGNEDQSQQESNSHVILK